MAQLLLYSVGMTTRHSLLTATAFVLVTATSTFAQSPSCTTTKPAPNWVCVAGGGWLPPGHPGIPTTPPPAVDVPTPNQPTPDVPFRIGRRYYRNASGTPTDIYIAGAGQLADGASVLFAVCRTTGDGCFFAGEVRMFPSNATAKDWEDRTNSPY